MKIKAGFLVVSFLALVGASTSHADSVIGYFNLTCPSGNCSAPEAGPGVTVGPTSTLSTAVGQIILTLNSDGTIAASLDDYGSATVTVNVWGFALNSSNGLTESAFTPGTPDGTGGWTESFGEPKTGFWSFSAGDNFSLQESWVIGTPGEFTSVWQALDGGSNSIVDFWLYDTNSAYADASGNSEYGANAQPYTPASATPEPGTILLLGSGLAGLAGMVRRKIGLRA
jgi:hypothetical protein